MIAGCKQGSCGGLGVSYRNKLSYHELKLDLFVFELLVLADLISCKQELALFFLLISVMQYLF